MRIAISAEGDRGLDSPVSAHFGRCPSFVLVDVEDGKAQELRVIDNPYYAQHEPGQVPAFIHSHDVDVMLTGGMGWRAISLFEEYGIEAVSGAQGTVRRALGGYIGGELRGVQPCEEGHAQPPPDGEYEQDDLGRLQEEMAMLREQMAQTLDRLDKLGGGN